MKMICPHGYSGIPAGAEVELVEIIPEYHDETSSSGFTWPEYTAVRYKGKEYSSHSHRFVLKENNE